MTRANTRVTKRTLTKAELDRLRTALGMEESDA